MNKLIGKPESKLFMGMAMSSVPRVARAESSVRVNDGAGLVTGGPESPQGAQNHNSILEAKL